MCNAYHIRDILQEMKQEELSLATLVARECKRLLEDTRLASWFQEKLEQSSDSRSFFIHFGLMGRKVPRVVIKPSSDIIAHLQARHTGFDPATWTLDDFCRLALMLRLDPAQGLEYIKTLVAAADMREQVIVYRSLPYFSNAEEYVMMAIDGIRTNMVAVFDAIAMDNQYPATYFEEAAWNQMVLKAIFMERPLYRIIGLDDRKNARLANILHDFTHERWSAGRPVTPELWRLVDGFIDDGIFADLQKVMHDGTSLAKQAAGKVLANTEFKPAIDWWRRQSFETPEVSWEAIGQSIQVKS